MLCFAPETLPVLLRCFVTHTVPTRALSCLLLGFSELRVLLPPPLPRAGQEGPGQAVLEGPGQAVLKGAGQAVLKGAVFLPSEVVAAWDLEEDEDDREPEALDTMAEWLSFAVGDEALTRHVVALVESVHNHRLALPRAFYVRAVTNLCAR